MMTLDVSQDFGYVVAVVITSVFLNIWLALRVSSARKKYGVRHPIVYSADSFIFNCYQRSHQNYIENYSFFLGLLILGGLVYPRVSAVAGVIFLLGRVVYALGYATGDPDKRLRGAFQHIGTAILICCTIKLASDLLECLIIACTKKEHVRRGETVHEGDDESWLAYFLYLWRYLLSLILHLFHQ